MSPRCYIRQGIQTSIFLFLGTLHQVITDIRLQEILHLLPQNSGLHHRIIHIQIPLHSSSIKHTINTYASSSSSFFLRILSRISFSSLGPVWSPTCVSSTSSPPPWPPGIGAAVPPPRKRSRESTSGREQFDHYEPITTRRSCRGTPGLPYTTPSTTSSPGSRRSRRTSAGSPYLTANSSS